MKKLTSFVLILFLSLLQATFSQGQTQEPKELTEARNVYNAELLKATKPVNDRYLPKLEELKKELTFRGNIKEAITVDEEIQQLIKNMPLRQQVSDDPSELTEIKKIYSIELDTAIKPVTSLYLAKLEVLKQQLAQDGNLRGALAVEQEVGKYKQSVMREDPIVGKWKWFTGDFHTFLPQGKIAGEPNSNWMLLDRDRNLYRIIWEEGKFIDTVTVSSDGRTLSGINKALRITVTGTKIQ